jgi:hypothetical protein
MGVGYARRTQPVVCGGSTMTEDITRKASGNNETCGPAPWLIPKRRNPCAAVLVAGSDRQRPAMENTVPKCWPRVSATCRRAGRALTRAAEGAGRDRTGLKVRVVSDLAGLEHAWVAGNVGPLTRRRQPGRAVVRAQFGFSPRRHEAPKNVFTGLRCASPNAGDRVTASRLRAFVVKQLAPSSAPTAPRRRSSKQKPHLERSSRVQPLAESTRLDGGGESRAHRGGGNPSKSVCNGPRVISP